MKQVLLIIMICISANVYSQVNDTIKVSNKVQPKEEKKEIVKIIEKNSVTIGFLNGGGSLVGADFEFLVTKSIGLQLGLGYLGFGGGINFHFKPSIRSSFLSLQYWNQGISNRFVQSVLGPNIVFRGKKWFTFQIGLGATLDKGPAFPSTRTQSPVILMYAIGAYIPLK